MKKSLLALAVLGAFAGAAHAQTSVTVYGIVDAGIQFDNAVAKKWSLASGQQSGSRIGFKGNEDLGGGLNAQFQLEQGFGVDDGSFSNGLGGSSKLFGRQAWVGLGSNGMGAVKLGRQQTALYNSVAVVDPFGIGLNGNMLKFFGNGYYNQGLDRTDNTVKYESPVVAGFSAVATYSFGENASNGAGFAAGQGQGAGIGYANGPINVQADFQQVRNVGGTTTPAVTSSGAVALPSGTATSALGAAPDLKTYFVGGYYDFGVAKLHLAYADTKATANGPGTGAARLAIGGTAKDRNYMVGVSAPVGAGNIMASWQRNDWTDFANAASNLYAVGYTYSLSKRTNLYSSVGYTRNDSGVNLNSGTGGNGKSDRNFQVGVRHLF
jgi:predicted porin